jgi:hypothetical protein
LVSELLKNPSKTRFPCFSFSFSNLNEALVFTGFGLGGIKHDEARDFVPYNESVSEEENPPELESEEIEVELKNRASWS